MQLFLKIISGMANSVEPNQTASLRTVRTGSAVFAYAILSESSVYKFLDIYHSSF